MKIITEIPDEILFQLATDIMENYPEFSFCLICVDYNYSEGKFVFLDEDSDEEYNVTINDVATKGLPNFIQAVLENKYYFDGLESINDLLDAGNYDSPSVDAVVQMTIFGEVIYG